MDIKETGQKITLALSEQEALVIFEWLARFNEEGHGIHAEHPVESQLLWNLEGCFEKVLEAPLASNYSDRLAAARDDLVVKTC